MKPKPIYLIGEVRVERMDGARFYQMVAAGGREVIRQQKRINAINVFPVADGDTGSNMAMTFDAVISNTRVDENLSETLSSMADAALTGARGNSGMILAQFFTALDGAPSLKYWSVEDFVREASRAAEETPRAVPDPREGTILTVLKRWARSLGAQGATESFLKMMSGSQKAAEDALARTEDQLEILRSAGVVDAGGQGFVSFLKGCIGYLENPEERLPSGPREWDAEVPAEPEVRTGFPDQRYCSEFVVETPGRPDRDRVIAAVEPLGSSLVVVTGGRRLRVHIHCDSPWAVVDRLRAFGRIVMQKVDDMVLEYEAVHRPRARIAVVTDSSCDLEAQLLRRHQIHVVPVTIRSGDEEFLDGITLEASRLQELMSRRRDYPTTSQPSLRAFEHLYSFLTAHYDHVISIHLSSQLSGTVRTARRAAETIAPRRIHVVDSRHLSGSLGMLVHQAALWAEEGLDPGIVVQKLEWARETAVNLVSVPSLKYMVRGGRVHPLKGVAAALLNLKPLVSVDEEGRSLLIGKSFSRRSSERKLIRLFLDRTWSRYAVVYTGSPRRARRLARRLERASGRKPEFLAPISSVVLLNAGPGAVSVAAL